MKVLIDAAHPADVWVLGAVENRLLDAGEETLWISRPGKDNVVELIETRDRPHVRGPQAGTNRLSLARELLIRDQVTLSTVRKFRPDVILTRSPAGVHAGRLTRTPVLYDTDDGHAVGLLFYLAGPFANLITTPMANTRSYGRRHRRYRGYKELFYLHPSRFTPDQNVKTVLGLAEDQRLFVLRLSALTASHDVGETGLSRQQINQVVERLSALGTVLISSEQSLPEDLAARQLPIPVQRFHHVLAAADLVIGDSQTVTSEAAILGTPSLNCNTWVGRLPYREELQHRWGLTKTFNPNHNRAFFAELERVLHNLDAERAAQQQRRQKMLEWCADPVDDVTSWLYELAAI